MKYHEKINLKSSIYKYQKTSKSKSPIKSPLKPSLNPADLFKKVCCPNCKYAFKIIKHDILSDIKPLDNREKSKKKNKLNKYIQTDNTQFANKTSSPNKFISFYKNSTSPNLRNNIQNSKYDQVSRLNSILQSENNEKSYLKDLDFKFKPLSVSQTNIKSKSNQLLNTLNIQKSPKRIHTNQRKYSPNSSNLVQLNIHMNDRTTQIYQNEQNINIIMPKKVSNSNLDHSTNQNLNSSRISKDIQQSSNSNENFTYNGALSSKKSHNQKNTILVEQSISKNFHHIEQSSSNKNPISLNQQNLNFIKPETERKLIDLYFKHQQTENILHEVMDFCKTLTQQIEVPSFCKMLTYIQPNLTEKLEHQ